MRAYLPASSAPHAPAWEELQGVDLISALLLHRHHWYFHHQNHPNIEPATMTTIITRPMTAMATSAGM
jgi:hypothetical protein